MAELTSLLTIVHYVRTLSYFSPHAGTDVTGLTSIPTPTNDVGTLAHTPSHPDEDMMEALAYF